MDVITKLYIGLNDKDTKKQEHELETFKTVLDFILFEHGHNAYTLEQAQGCYKGDTENTLIITLINVSKDIKILCDDIKQSFNQECIMIEQYKSNIAFV